MISGMSEDRLAERAGNLEEKYMRSIAGYSKAAYRLNDEKEIRKIGKIMEEVETKIQKANDACNVKSCAIRSKYAPRSEVRRSKIEAANIAKLNAEIRAYQSALEKMEKTLK